MDETEEELREQLRELLAQKERLLKKELYKSNLWELCKLIGFNDLGECHKELCAELDRTDKAYTRRVFMYPRGHFKTSIITIANTVKRILNDPNSRILIASSTLENAKECLGVIKSVFWRNEEFRKIFPEFCPPDGAKEFGTLMEFTVPNRTLLTLKNATVEVAGDGQTITGRHYEKIVFTDIVNPENSQSKYQLDNTIKWCSYCLSLLDNPLTNQCDMEGTRYDHGDVYGDWIEKAKKAKKTYFMMIKPAIYVEDGIEKSLFHEKFDLESLRALEVEQGSFVFAGQYMLSPVDEGTASFKRESIRYIQRRDIPRAKDNKFKYELYMTIDPAISESQKADHSVITIGMVDEKNILYIIDIKKGHWNTTKLLDTIWDTYYQYRPRLIGIETVAFQKMLATSIMDLGRSKGVILPVKEIVRNTSKSKVMRILSLVPRFEQKMIFFADDLDKAFIEMQILRFNPDKKNNKDDLLDSIADMVDIKITPKDIKDSVYKEHPGRRYIDWLERPLNGEEEDGREREYLMVMEDEIDD